MRPAPKRQRSSVVNWSIPGQLIDQSPAAVVVVNWPPFRGPLITRRHCHPHWPHLVPTLLPRSPTAVLGYAGALQKECIGRRKRHRSTVTGRKFSFIRDVDVVR
jgi:hypothetical protein